MFPPLGQRWKWRDRGCSAQEVEKPIHGLPTTTRKLTFRYGMRCTECTGELTDVHVVKWESLADCSSVQ